MSYQPFDIETRGCFEASRSYSPIPCYVGTWVCSDSRSAAACPVPGHRSDRPHSAESSLRIRTLLHVNTDSPAVHGFRSPRPFNCDIYIYCAVVHSHPMAIFSATDTCGFRYRPGTSKGSSHRSAGDGTFETLFSVGSDKGGKQAHAQTDSCMQMSRTHPPIKYS